jgi:hypothetical protein
MKNAVKVHRVEERCNVIKQALLPSTHSLLVRSLRPNGVPHNLGTVSIPQAG